MKSSQQFLCRFFPASLKALFIAGACGLTACSPAPLSTLNPAGPQADHVARVWRAMAWGSALILLFMVLLAVVAVMRKETLIDRTRNRVLLWGGGVIFPLIVLIAVLVYGHSGGSAATYGAQPPFRVQVHAHQWWWEVRYLDSKRDAGTSDILYSANELHVPVNRPIQVELTSNDVIHSFWVPRLGGKMDAIPGRTNRLELLADEPGVYQGICAEFCGEQHARMQFRVIAHKDEDLAARLHTLERSRLDYATDEHAEVGRSVFLMQCAACHSVDPRQPGAAAPNLADLPWRLTLGAGILDNDDHGLRLWLRSHAVIKPGNHMPLLDLDEDELSQLAAYLGTVRSADE